MWEQALKLDDDDVIEATISAAGLPTDEIMTAMGDPIVKQRLIESTEHSVGRGTFGSPTLFVGDEIYFGKDKLRDAIEGGAGINLI
jgi:2-hydroxychromene-2-carboxylate isomerase